MQPGFILTNLLKRRGYFTPGDFKQVIFISAVIVLGFHEQRPIDNLMGRYLLCHSADTHTAVNGGHGVVVPAQFADDFFHIDLLRTADPVNNGG